MFNNNLRICQKYTMQENYNHKLKMNNKWLDVMLCYEESQESGRKKEKEIIINIGDVQ